LLEINPDGTFSMWRSVGNATQPPAPIGRFAGQLEPQIQAELQQAAAKAVEAGNFKLTPPPGAATETITLDQVQARLGANDEPEGAWAGLIEQLRRLLGDLTASPQAAISLELLDGGRAARLTHHGPDALQLDLSGLTVRAVLWEGYNKAGDWRANELPAGATDNITAGPGWSFDLPLAHGFNIAPSQEVVAYVTFAAFDGEQAIPVALETMRSSQN
jgi:hypothetical protein